MFKTFIENNVQKELFEYWKSKSSLTRLPSRKDIQPEEIVPLLPHVGLINVLGPRNFSYRLIGTAMVELFDKDFTGQIVAAAKPGSYGRFLMDLYAETVALKCPIYSRSQFLYRGDRGLITKRLLLPLVDEKKRVNMLLFSTMPEYDHSDEIRDIKVIDDSIGFKELFRIEDIKEFA